MVLFYHMSHSFRLDSLTNTGLKMAYLALIALQIILGLGNRPKAERFAYTMSIWLFGLLALYLVTNTLYLTAMALCPMQSKINEALDKGQSVIQIFTNGTFGPIVRATTASPCAAPGRVTDMLNANATGGRPSRHVWYLDHSVDSLLGSMAVRCRYDSSVMDETDTLYRLRSLLNSFVQYLFITISFTNVLAVYSFCSEFTSISSPPR